MTLVCPPRRSSDLQVRLIVRFPVGDGRQYAVQVAAATAWRRHFQVDAGLGERAEARHRDPDQHDKRPQDQHRARCEDIRRHMARSEEHTSELQSLMRISYAVFCLKKKNTPQNQYILTTVKTI